MANDGVESGAFREYVGSLHIHSNYSDGLRSIPDIAGIAGESGIDFLLFADHMTLEPLRQGMQKWFGPVLAVIGYEANDPDNRNHYLIYGLTETLTSGLSAQEYVRRVKEVGGIGFIAHPDEKRIAFPKFPPYPWTAWDAVGYDGIEVWNHSSEWLEKLNRFNKYYHVLHPLKFLRGPEPETLARWDHLNLTRSMPGIGGIDAHAYPYRLGPFTIYIFRYKVLFKGIRTHILVDEPLSADATVAKDTVLDALRRARCFISNYRWGDARGFRFEAKSAGRTVNMGGTIDAPRASLRVQVPERSVIRLLRNGTYFMESRGTELVCDSTNPGAYRVEVYRKRKPWIYSNHIRIRGDATDDK